jgi:hypothetical protein
MNMEIVRLVNASRLGAGPWRGISDRQVMALRTIWSSDASATAYSDTNDETEPRRVPLLDWPEDLFDDEISCR